MSNVCGRCGRKLSSLESQARGYGETCWRKVNATAAVLYGERKRGLIGAFGERQIDAAVETVELGAIVHVGDDKFVILSTDGLTLYTSTIFTCNCPAGERNESCYHQASAVLLQAAV